MNLSQETCQDEYYFEPSGTKGKYSFIYIIPMYVYIRVFMINIHAITLNRTGLFKVILCGKLYEIQLNTKGEI